MNESQGPTISGVEMKCRVHGIDLVKTADGYKCPKCDIGIKLSGDAKIVIK
jgi:hypothetical protein